MTNTLNYSTNYYIELTLYYNKVICVTSPTNWFLGPIEQCSLLTLLKHCCARCKNSNKFGFNSLASALRHPPGYSCAVATCDLWLLALSIGQFVLLRPQIGFSPIDSTRLSRPAWHKLRLCCTRLFAARAIYRSICVTSPTNCPIGLRPKFGCARHNASKLAFCSRLHGFSPRCGSWGAYYFAHRLPHSPRWVLPSWPPSL